MEDIVTNFYVNQSVAQYEKSHGPRLNFLVEDLKLGELQNSVIGDFGCGYGPIFARMGRGKGNEYFGFDGAAVSEEASKVCTYRQTDLNLPFADKFLQECYKLDIGMTFETIEHLTNPYNCLSEMKKVVKENGTIIISIPHEQITHNTIYPGLLYPESNFQEFLRQMALPVMRHAIHDKSFKQNVYVCRNAPWGESQMRWHKNEDKFRNIPPVVAVNL